ncbi:MAG: cyclodeaminase/cyclohydrolase family protein [Candidatus Eremiobacteraeota bacterium]|nr:cyclodeaminase/cyclohydrolase family protein [Candidatus Eremiobacteraeota bacterium]MBC5827253.1 cyclodeaminase/cyclohydrolase family protein [Candidatus Eremiobacteraeota bacterium]
MPVRLPGLTLDDFAGKVASADPTPGGGSVCALLGSLSAGLIQMVARLTSGSPKFAEVSQCAQDIGEDAGRLRSAFLTCIDDDAAAFDRVSQAYRMPKASDAEKAARSAQIQTTLLAAALPPLRVIEMAHQTAALAASLIDIGNPSATSDIGCAALCAHAAAQGAAFNVRINLQGVKDAAQARVPLERTAAALAQIDILTEVVTSKVQAAVGV